jgi:hypothetical protein
MTQAQWASLQPKQQIEMQHYPWLSAVLVQKDHFGQWIGIILDGQELVRSVVVETVPKSWRPVS